AVVGFRPMVHTFVLEHKVRRRFSSRWSIAIADSPSYINANGCIGARPTTRRQPGDIMTLISKLGLTLAAALALHATAATAADYHQRPIRLIVPFSEDGNCDVLARAVGQKLAENLGQPVAVENRPGANGNIGSDAVAKAAPVA